jgi:hypothetical protein
MRPAREQDPAVFGFALKHWQAISRYAIDHKWVLWFRGGNPRAVAHIESGFPAKPLSLKFKVDRATGLLIAKTKKDERVARKASYGLLRLSDTMKGEFIAADPDGKDLLPGHRFRTERDRWAAEINTVIDLDQRLPVTSDYDLAAVFNIALPWNKSNAFNSAAPANQIIRPDEDHNNHTTRRLIADLNEKLGSVRITHGPQANYMPEADDSRDSGVVFHPSGEVEVYENVVLNGTEGHDFDLLLESLLERYFPNPTTTH